MKKTNLIERLWTDSHEKQSPQRFARYAAILIMLLTLGVGQMWADGTYTVVGMAAPNANDYYPYIRINTGGGDGCGTWNWYFEGNKTGITFEGRKLYIANWTDCWGGTDEMYFYEHSDKSGTEENYNTVHNSWWGADGYNHKIYQYNESGTSGSWYATKTMTKGARVYFDASTWDETSIKLVTGHANHQKYDGMSAISNTKLYYGTSSATTWTDAMGWGIVGNTTAETGDNWLTNVSNKASEYTGWKNWSLENAGDNNAYLCVPNGDAGEEPSMSYYATHYNSGALNNTQTIKYAVGINGATPTELTSGYVPADIAISSYKFSNGKYNAVDASSGSVTLSKNGSNYSATVTAARTATTTYTVSNVHEDYSFLGWYSAASGGTLLSSDASYTFYPTSATTAYARFSKENNHTVTISRYCTSTSSEISSTTAKVGEVTYSEISAPVIAGYSFVNWTVGSGLTVKSGDNTNSNPIHVITKASGDYTLTANYTEVLTTDWKLIGDNQANSPFGDNYAYASGKAMSKKSGYSTSSDAYITLNITHLPASYYGFKVATATGNANSYGWGNTDGAYITFNRSISNTSQQVYNGDQHELKFVPDALGEYEFRVNYPGNKYVYVTFPTSYAVSYNIGSVAGTSGSISATYSSVAFASGTKIQSGKSVTLTAPAAKSGYSWKGWYTNAAGTTGNISDVDRAITVTVDAAKSLYACYTEDMHDVTVNVTGSGTVSYGAGAAGSSCTASAGIATASSTIHAIPAAGYAFIGWTNVDADHHITDFNATWNNTNEGWDLTVNADDATTIVANFAPRFALVGAISATGNPKGGMPGWDLEDAAAFTYSAGTYTITPTLTSSNTTYAFKIIDRRAETWIWRGYTAASNNLPVDNSTTYTLTANGGNNVYFDTKAAGDYTFTVVEETITGVKYPKVKIACPTSRQITIGQKSIYDPAVTNTSDATTTGGNVTAEDNSSNTITTGQYVADGANVTFTAHPATGYAFKGWYQNADCTTPYVDNSGTENTVVIDAEAKTLTLRSIAADKAVYAKYEEIMTRIAIMTYGGKFRVDGGDPTDIYNDPYLQVGVKTTHTVSIASEDAGHYFSNWELSAAEDEAVNFSISGSAENEDNRSITVTGLGVETRTHLNFLEPKFKQLESIYFRNIFDDGETVTHWENVYVCFDITWAEYSGKQAAQTSTYNTSKNLHVQMEGGSNYIYRAYVPRYITRNNKSNVAFVNYDPNYADGTGNYLYNGIACSRGDYSPKHNMFVPYHVKSHDANSVAYYNSGYWMHYSITPGVDAGYWIERRTGTNTYSGKPAEQFVIVKRAYEDNPSIQYRLRIDGLSNDKYAIFSEGGLKYKAASTITHSACDGIEVVEDNSGDAYFVLTPTAEGEYIITLDQSGDKMKISVEYPVVIGDYVIENAFNDGSAKTTRSNVIKASKAGTKTRYSMYLNNAGSGTLKLRKCTSIDGGGNPVWSAGDNTNLQPILDNPEFTKGVYQFDIAVSGDVVSEIDSVRLYTGDYYIKTDAADGGWVAYKKNILDKNTVNFDRTSATYDNYFCKYFASRDCNIKSVIANDYCNQLSDTVKLDGIARNVDGEPFVPVDGTSIRFSYNSATNETKRAYLGASLDNEYLDIMPYESGKIYNTAATPVDLYGTTADKRRFSDMGNWVYEINLKVKPGGKAGVQAAFTDATPTKHYQTLIPNDNVVLGGSSSNMYTIRVVYDFKTNFMMSAFKLDNETTISEDLSDFDMLWVRHKDEAATQLTLGDGNKLTNIRPIGAIELRYDSVHWKGSGTYHQDLSTWNPLTRPYLKYFVSFPFDVAVNSIFGLNQAKLGTDYIIQGYNGAKRASDGLFLGDGDTYWEYLTEDSIMHAGQGYYVIFDNDYARGMSGHIWDNKGAGSSVYMYFPATEEIATIDNTNQTSIVPKHTCTIDRAWKNNEDKNHMNTDSHWNTVGSPLFHNSYINGYATAVDTALTSYYYLDNPVYGTQPTWMVQAIKDAPMFKAMSAVLVQWAGTITWTTTEKNIFSAPRRKAEDEKNYFIKLDMLMNGELRDWTYLDLKEGAVADFLLNEDMSKVNNRGVPNIYSFAGAYDVAYNTLPIENQTIPVGMIIRKAGTYTFSMPYNFSGTVTLIDTYEQTRTNLGIEDYEVELTKGTIDDRFLLEIDINKMPTAIENAEGGSSDNRKVYKYIENGNLYIMEGGHVFDAQGKRVK